MEGMWRLGRGLALVATGRFPGAEGEHVALAGLTKQIRRDHTTEENLAGTSQDCRAGPGRRTRRAPPAL